MLDIAIIAHHFVVNKGVFISGVFSVLKPQNNTHLIIPIESIDATHRIIFHVNITPSITIIVAKNPNKRSTGKSQLATAIELRKEETEEVI